MSRIYDAVRRILRLKVSDGLFETPLAGTSFLNKIYYILMKNGKPGEEPLLPLPKKAKILVAGSHADNLGYQCGGWTITWQGLSGNNITDGTTILQAITNTVDPETELPL
ncbi:Beta-glucosidase BoGH3B-like protein [Drosera capensis]